MNNNTLKIVAVVGVIIIGILANVMTAISYRNQAAQLRNQVSAQQQVNETIFDTAWKTIASEAQISTQYETQFKSVYGTIMTDRYGNGQDDSHLLAKFITEHNPQFDSSLLQQLDNTVESQRATFQQSQAQILDYQREYNNLLTTAPADWYVRGAPLNVTIVTSTTTQNTFSTGKDDNVNLFPGASN